MRLLVVFKMKGKFSPLVTPLGPQYILNPRNTLPQVSEKSTASIKDEPQGKKSHTKTSPTF